MKNLSQSAGALKSHCAFVFDVLIAKLSSVPEPVWPDSIPDQRCPLFVTYYKGESKELRGCIGTFAQEPVKVLLPQYALVAAFEDSRFSPITAKEVASLTVEVSLLTNFEDASDIWDWIFNEHGIQIEFKAQGRNYRSTFLPHVAEH